MQEAEKIGHGHNEIGEPHHLLIVSLHDHWSQILHRTAADQPTEQKVCLFHVCKEHLNGIWQQHQHQQQEVEGIWMVQQGQKEQNMIKRIKRRKSQSKCN